MGSIGRRSCEKMMTEKNTLVGRICVLSDRNKRLLEWEITSFSKTTLLQRELFYTIDSSPMLVTKSVFKLIFLLSNYQTCTFPLSKISNYAWWEYNQFTVAPCVNLFFVRLVLRRTGDWQLNSSISYNNNYFIIIIIFAVNHSFYMYFRLSCSQQPQPERAKTKLFQIDEKATLLCWYLMFLFKYYRVRWRGWYGHPGFQEDTIKEDGRGNLNYLWFIVVFSEFFLKRFVCS